MTRHTQTPRRQRGASLVELMVGLTIGLLVVLAAMGTIVLTRSSSTTVADSSVMITQGNNAMRLIGQTLRQSGAIELVPLDATQPLGSRQYVFSNDFTGVGGTGFVMQGTEGGTSGTDTLTVSYQNRTDDTTRDCLGNTTPAGLNRVENLFSVNGTELRCLGSGNATPQPVVDNLEDFQVLYWVQTGTGAAATQIRRAADQVVAAGGWNNVVAVDVCLQLRGEVSNHPIIAGSTFTNCQEAATAHDGRMHQVFRSTFDLRNRGQ